MVSGLDESLLYRSKQDSLSLSISETTICNTVLKKIIIPFKFQFLILLLVTVLNNTRLSNVERVIQGPGFFQAGQLQ